MAWVSASVFLGFHPTHDTGSPLPCDVTSEKISEELRRVSPQVAWGNDHVDQSSGPSVGHCSLGHLRDGRPGEDD